MNESLLKKRMKETPEMEVVDAVKLAYQSEFGCGHLLAEEAVCAARIAEEMAQTAPWNPCVPFVEIGGGLCRLNLHAGSVRALSPQTLARMMRTTADQVRGSQERFAGTLEKVRALCAQGGLPFASDALETYLSAYARDGYPPVSHSARYRAAYAPAYRVVLRGYGDALPILGEVEKRLAEDGRCLLVLDGDCGAGKTTLADLIAPLYHGNLIRMDEFFLPPALRTEERLRQAGGNTHYERFGAEVLVGLAHGKPFSYASYDCHSGQSARRPIVPAPVTVIEGSYSHHPYFEEAYQSLNALRVLVKVEHTEQLRRLERRNPALLSRFQQEWIPLEKAYFRTYDTEQGADLVVESPPWEEMGP